MVGAGPPTRLLAVLALCAGLAGGCPKKVTTPVKTPTAGGASPTAAGPRVPPPSARRPPPKVVGNDPLATFAQGVDLSDAQPELATEAFRKVVQRNPKIYVAHYNLAVLAERLGHDKTAREHYLACLEVAGDYAPALTNLVNLLLRRGETQAAVRLATRYSEQNKTRLDIRALRVKALLAARRDREAEQVAKSILRDDEKNVGAMVALSMIYYRQGRFELSAHALRQALKVDPENPEVHHRLGHALRAMKETGRALAEFEKAVELKADFPEALNSLAVVLLERGQVGRALNLLEQAVQLSPNFWQAHLNLGNALRKSGAVERAKKGYLRVLALRPGLADAYYNLGLLYLDHKMADAAGDVKRLETALTFLRKYRERRRGLGREDPARRYLADAEKKLVRLRKTEARRRERERLRRLRRELEGRKLQLGGK